MTREKYVKPILCVAALAYGAIFSMNSHAADCVIGYGTEDATPVCVQIAGVDGPHVAATTANAAVYARQEAWDPMFIVDLRSDADVRESGVAMADVRIPFAGRPGDDPDFVAAVRAALHEHRMDESARIALLSTSGDATRATELLAASGFERIYTIAGGFTGSGEIDGMRVAGWKGAGMPWATIDELDGNVDSSVFLAARPRDDAFDP
jgi:rhodanese-related sulfurtransferase